MNHSYKLLGTILVCPFGVLLLLQVTLGFFSSNNALTFPRPQSAMQQSNKPNAPTRITGGQGGA
jgi:hypothetical protein